MSVEIRLSFKNDYEQEYSVFQPIKTRIPQLSNYLFPTPSPPTPTNRKTSDASCNSSCRLHFM